MARFKDIVPSQQGWISELAKAEVHPEAERILGALGGSHFDPEQRVEESAIDFLTQLHDYLSEYARIFNAFSESGARFQEVKIYNLANSPADFMVFRNQIKLVFSHAAHGILHIVFAQHHRATTAVDGQAPAPGHDGQSQELHAQIGPFRDVHWTFQGERVSPEQVAQFYFSEFTRATREFRRGKSSNQALLDQIKTLLEEKGLDL
jgi:hypothetical protein